jgi:hypothetical protein
VSPGKPTIDDGVSRAPPKLEGHGQAHSYVEAMPPARSTVCARPNPEFYRYALGSLSAFEVEKIASMINVIGALMLY